jgi:DNA processing protein
MTFEHTVALSLVPNLPRCDLGDRLRQGDPNLEALADLWRAGVHDALTRAARVGAHALAWNDPRYPTPLLAIPDFPPVLWFRGTLEALTGTAVAVVGSRAASHVGLEVASRIGAGLVGAGVVVVSGLARGVDSAAHRGALTTGRTIAVLGSGIDRIYPPEHASLAAEISANGLVLSEYPPGTPPLAFHFPQRNRLISGLSRAVVVIEASDRSGSLITAGCALDQGRDVMVVPGNVLSGRSRGGHALIRDGAKIVESADDIVQELGLDRPQNGRSTSVITGRESVLSADPVLRAMDAGDAYDLDGLAKVSGLDGARLLTRLLDLELRGCVRRVGGGRFVRSA